MRLNQLKLNDSKTEAIVFGTRQKLSVLDGVLNRIRDETVSLSHSVRNLGAFFDESLKMDTDATKVCRAANMHIRNIARIRHFLSSDVTKSLVNSLVTSRLDYANAVIYGVTAKNISKLQIVQNAAARIITFTPRRQHITPVLHKLH